LKKSPLNTTERGKLPHQKEETLQAIPGQRGGVRSVKIRSACEEEEAEPVGYWERKWPGFILGGKQRPFGRKGKPGANQRHKKSRSTCSRHRGPPLWKRKEELQQEKREEGGMKPKFMVPRKFLLQCLS